MFAFLKKHAVAITVTTGAIVAAAIGFAWFRPGTVNALLRSTGAAITGFGGAIAGFFRRNPSPVDVATTAMGPDAPAAA